MQKRFYKGNIESYNTSSNTWSNWNLFNEGWPSSLRLKRNFFVVNNYLILILFIKNLLPGIRIKISGIVFSFYFFIIFLSVLDLYFYSKN